MSIRNFTILLLSLLFLSSANVFAKTNDMQSREAEVRTEIDRYKQREEYRKQKEESRKRANINKAWNKIKEEEIIKAFGSKENEDFFHANIAPLVRKNLDVETPRISDWSLVYENKHYPGEGRNLVVSKYYPNGVIFPDSKTGVLTWYEKPAYLARITKIEKIMGRIRSSEGILTPTRYIFSLANNYIERDETVLFNEDGEVIYKRNYKGDRFLDYWLGKKPRVAGSVAELPLFYGNKKIIKYEVPLIHDLQEVINQREAAFREAGFSETIINKFLRSDNIEIATECLAIDDDYSNNLLKTKGGYGYAQALVNSWTVVYDSKKGFPHINLEIAEEDGDKRLTAHKPASWAILKDGTEQYFAPKQKIVDCVSKKGKFVSRLQPENHVFPRPEY